LSDNQPLLTLNDVRFGFSGKAEFLGPIAMTVRRGDCWGVIGPNGAGKSTLLRLLAGLHGPSAGSIALSDRPLASWSPRERALRMAYVPQTPSADLADAARDVVLMGRFPHRSLGLFESPHDLAVVERVMRETQTDPYADRAMATLSGGEARRVHLAAALAQETALLLLDEPTSSLDIHHELTVFDMLRRRANDGGRAVVAVTHDVNLAGRFCTHVLLMSEGRCVAQGPPSEVITPETLEPVYGVRMASLELPGDGKLSWVVPVDAVTGAGS